MAQVLFWATIALLVVVAIVSLDIMGFSFWKSNKFQVEGRTVLLTGASQGMGKELCRILAERGANIILVARNVEKLQAAMEYAKASAKNPSTQRFHYISVDVRSEDENTRMLAEATAWNNGRMPEIVWANAGSSTPGLFIEYSMDTLRHQMDLDYFAGAILAHKTLRSWFYPSKPYSFDATPEPPRHFILTSSALAFANVTGYSSYSPAKAALRSLADGLRSEVLLYNGARRSKNKATGQAPAPFDVQIHSVFPGTIRSPGFDNENKTKHPVTFQLEESDPVQSEAEAAMGAIRGLENGEFMTATSWFVQVMRLGALAHCPRDNLIRDTLGAWLLTIVWLFVGWDLDSKVWGWGKKEGMPIFRENAQ